jgi:prolipoprotein diacylglyceryltransferase
MFHFPVVFQWGPLTLTAHFLFETLAFFIGFRYFLFLRNRQGDRILESNRVWIFIGASLGALIFSRLLGAMEEPSAFFRSEHPFLRLFMSKTMVGGLLGGLFGVELIKKILGEKRSSGDLFTFPLILGIILGRIGCFLNGTAEPVYGYPTNLWTGMNLGDGLLRHPIALYEIAFLVLLWLCIAGIEKKWTLQEGLRFKLFMISYLLFRLLIDFIKPREELVGPMGAIQIACILGLLYYSKTIINLIFNPREMPVHGR